MKLYTSDGKPARGKNPRDPYYYRGGELKPVPSVTDSKDDILDFIESCIGEVNPGVTRKDLLEYWDFYLQKNKVIVTYLKSLLAKHTAEGDKRRIDAYKTAIRSVERSKVPIASGAQGMKLKGIGKKIGAKIDEIVQTGHLETIDTRLEEELEKQRTLELFMSVWGIGAKRAQELYNEGYRTLEDLESANITDQARLGLKYHADFLERIPREEITDIEPQLKKLLLEINPEAKFCIGGSYRRGFPTSGDIDIIISSDDPRVLLFRYLQSLQDNRILVDNLSVGSKKYAGVGQLRNGRYVRVDILSLPPGQWGTGILYFSSGAEFNKEIRSLAQSKGYKLSETGMKDLSTGKMMEFPTEKDVFKRLGIDYVPPKKR